MCVLISTLHGLLIIIAYLLLICLSTSVITEWKTEADILLCWCYATWLPFVIISLHRITVGLAGMNRSLYYTSHPVPQTNSSWVVAVAQWHRQCITMRISHELEQCTRIACKYEEFFFFWDYFRGIAAFCNNNVMCPWRTCLSTITQQDQNKDTMENRLQRPDHGNPFRCIVLLLIQSHTRPE